MSLPVSPTTKKTKMTDNHLTFILSEMNYRGPFFFLLLGVSTLLSQFEFGAPASDNLIFCVAAAPSTFNPQLAGDGPTVTAVSYTIYNRLVEFKPKTMDLVPALASRWTVSKDGKEWTFFLRKDVRWHETPYFKPTRGLTARDVVFSFERQLYKTSEFHLVGGGVYPYFGSMGLDRLIREVKEIDDYTVKFTLHSPSAPFLANLAMDSGVILSDEYAKMLLSIGKKEDIDNKPVGTGPYSFISYDQDALIRFLAHPQYFRGPPKTKSLLIQVVPESNVRLQKLKARECDVIDDPSPSDFKAIRQDPGMKLVSGSSTALSFLNINTYIPPFNDVRVRQAIFHALNRDSYVQAVYLGNATVARSVLPPTLWGHTPSLPQKSFDPEKAKRLLAEAGFPKGFTMDLWYVSTPRFYNPNGKSLGEMMQNDLAQVGIKVTLVTYDWGTYIRRLWAGEHTVAQSGWISDNGDPDNFLYLPNNCDAKNSGARKSAWCDSKFEDLLLKAQRTYDQSERIKLYHKAQHLFASELPWIPITFTDVTKAMLNDVQGYTVQPTGYSSFEAVYKGKAGNFK